MHYTITLIHFETLHKESMMAKYKQYRCKECEHVYDEEKGDPDSGLAPGTLWDDIPGDWACPICGAPKSFFELIQ